MTKLAAIKTTNQTKEEKVRQAKRAFLLGLMDLSWKLAAAFLVPLLIGVALDSGRDSNGYTVAGMLVGFALAFLVIFKLARDSGSQK